MGMNALEVRRRVMMAQPHEAVASGAVASFRTDVISPLPMEFDLVPIQDLHGQANPYPPGGGKNLFDIDGYLTDRSASYTKSGDTYTITATTSLYMNHYVFSDTDEQVTISFGSFANGTTTNVRIDVLNANGTVVKTIYPNTGTQTIIASKMRFNWTNQGNFTISKLQIERGSSATPYAPYSNLCPITGHDGFTRYGTGKNLWNFLKSGQDINPSGVDTTNKTIQIRAYDDRNKKITNGLKFKENTQYTVILKLYRSNGTTSGTSYGSNVGVEYTDGTKTGITYVSAGDSVFVTTVFTTNATKNVKCISVFNNSGFSYIKYEESGIFEGVLTADQFASYVGHSYETTFPTPPGTVYGGHVRDNGDGTGTLVVDRLMVDMGTLSWTRNATTYSYAYFYSGRISNFKNDTVLSDRYKYVGARNNLTENYTIGYYNGRIALRDDDYSTKSELETALDGVYAVYHLEEPIEYTLSITAIQSLIGQNHIWVDNADEVSVEHWGH